VPPRLPDRYEFEVRLGRDDDMEEWLATDTALDRPVLIRIVGPETTDKRRGEFLEAVRGAAGVTHTHLASVYAADQLPDGAYSVSEWAGGLTLAHRVQAGETMPIHEFLPNAAGLAEALAALHSRGVLHGAIGAGTIFFSMDHPAKLAGFGRHSEGASVTKDVRELADTLITAVTGSKSYDVAPSQRVDGLSPVVDRVLRRAQTGDLDAGSFAELLRAAPSSSSGPGSPTRSWSWRWMAPALLLLAAAVVLFVVGRALDTGSQDPLLFPVAPDPPTIETSTTPAQSPSTPTPSTTSIREVRVFDPEGDGSEHDSEIPNLTDGDASTAWNTERYDDPLPLIKGGVGFAVGVTGAPSGVELLGSADGLSYRVFWSRVFSSDVADWDPVAGGSIHGGRGALQLPDRTDGYWLVWLTDLPEDPDGGFVGSIGEVRFQP
jgi:serine/threonine protein kinase